MIYLYLLIGTYFGIVVFKGMWNQEYGLKHAVETGSSGDAGVMFFCAIILSGFALALWPIVAIVWGSGKILTKFYHSTS